jgi:hypothetical protein
VLEQCISRTFATQIDNEASANNNNNINNNETANSCNATTSATLPPLAKLERLFEKLTTNAVLERPLL